MAAWVPPYGRPLLGVRRADTRAACAELGLTPWEDPHNLDPRYTRVRVRTEDVTRGMVLHLGAGSVLPVDGTVVEGAGEIDESSMTGEAALVRKEPGATVYAGTALESGDLDRICKHG